MLIIDEIHALLVGTPREQRIILTVIRLLANDLRIALVCLGIEEAHQALMTDDPWADRFAAAELPAWEDNAAFEQLLLSFESVLPLRQPSEFRDAESPSAHPQLDPGCVGPYLPADGNRRRGSDPVRRRADQPGVVERRTRHRIAGVDRGSAHSASLWGMNYGDRSKAVAVRSQADSHRVGSLLGCSG